MTQSARRDLWTAIHRWTGLAMAVLLTIAAVTGCILSIKRPLDRTLNADLFQSRSAGPSLSPFIAVERFRAAHPELIVLAMPARAFDDRNILLGVGAASGYPAPTYNQVFLDRVDGHMVGSRSSEAAWNRRGIMEKILQLHYTLLMGDWGRWLLGIAAIVWLLSNFVGVYLTWPRKRPYATNWTRMWKISFKGNPLRFMLDIHRASGLWLLIGISILALTSVSFNFYDELFEPTLKALLPPTTAPLAPSKQRPSPGSPTLTYQQAAERALTMAKSGDVGSWRPSTVTYAPRLNAFTVAFTDDGTVNYRRLGAIVYYIDASTGQLVRIVDPYRPGSAGTAIERSLYPLHSGQIGGTVTIVLVVAMGLATLEMSITGVYLWWKKRKGKVAAKAAKASAAAKRAAAALATPPG